MKSITEFSQNIKPVLTILTIAIAAVIFAIHTPQASRSVTPDLITFPETEVRTVFVTANGHTWLMEL